MRATEFLIEAAQGPNFYAVGDSVAYNIAMSGAPWKSLAQMGTTSSSPTLTQAIDSIPQGSIVAISVGADEAGGMNPNVNQIVQSINSLMFRASTKGLKPVFVLFPQSAVKNQELGSQLRQSILSTLGKTSLILDMQTSEGNVANYTTIAKQIVSKFSAVPGATTASSSAAIKQLKFAHPEQSNINPKLAEILLKIFSQYGQSFVIQSGYRSPTHNKNVGGAKDSAHTRANAVDLATKHLSNSEKLKLIQIASQNGIAGIGVYDNGSLHFDIDTKYAPRRAWGTGYHYTGLPKWAKPTIDQHLAGRFSSNFV